MDEKIYTITLADGTELTNLRLNGNNFISESPIDTAVFQGNLSPVTIYDGDGDTDDGKVHYEIHENMEFMGETRVGDLYGFILRDISGEKLAEMKLRSDVEYIAMMCDVEL